MLEGTRRVCQPRIRGSISLRAADSMTSECAVAVEYAITSDEGGSPEVPGRSRYLRPGSEAGLRCI